MIKDYRENDMTEELGELLRNRKFEKKSFLIEAIAVVIITIIFSCILYANSKQRIQNCLYLDGRSTCIAYVA